MNCAELQVQLRERFQCIDGFQRAYVEIPLSDATAPLEARLVHRLVFKQSNVMMRGEPEHVEPILCAWAAERFRTAFPEIAMEDRDVLILWRRWPSIMEFRDEQGCVCTSMYMRLIVPGYDLPVPSTPEGGEGVWL